MFQQKISPARIFLLLAIVVSVGAVLGILLIAGKIGKINLPVANPPGVDFYTCADDSDCISVDADCCGCTAGGKATAINKNLKDQWKNKLSIDCKDIACSAVMSGDPSCISKEPRCTDNRCVLKEKTVIESKCSQKVKFSDMSKCPLSRIVYGYEFDSVAEKCKEVEVYGGCDFETPFTSLGECQKTCETGTVSEKELKFETIEKKDFSRNQEQKNYVIKNRQEWSGLWFKMGYTRFAPIVDFTKDMVIAVFQGEKSSGGYDVEINKIIENENTIEVSVIETSPARGCNVTMAFTSPYHIVKIQKSNRDVVFDVVFKIKKAVNDCK